MSRDKTREIKSPIDSKTREIRMEKTTEMPTVAPSQDVTARMKSPDALEAMIRLRMSAHDAHYGGSLVDGARMLSLFGDVATELLIRLDGDEGLFRAYDSVEFLAPVHAGDYIEARGKILSKSTTARRMSFEAWKVISPRPDVSDSAADVLREPVLVCRASGTCVVPQAKQRGGG